MKKAQPKDAPVVRVVLEFYPRKNAERCAADERDWFEWATKGGWVENRQHWRRPRLVSVKVVTRAARPVGERAK